MRKKRAPDLISGLPDPVLSFILSFLPIDDAVRSSVLSKRWKDLWKEMPHLDFDVSKIMRFSNSSLDDHLDKQEVICRYNAILFQFMQQHFGKLTSCRFFHFPNDDIRPWIIGLVERKELWLKDLTLECETMGAKLKPKFPKPYIRFPNVFSCLDSLELIGYRLDSVFAFTSCKKLRTLKLKDIYITDKVLTGILKKCVSLENFTLSQSLGFSKIKFVKQSLKFLELNFLWLDEIDIVALNLEVVVLVSISCRAKDLVLETPNLKVFHCFNNGQLPIESQPLNTHQLLQYSTGLLEPKRTKGFWNLSSMSIDLNLNDLRQTFSLSYMLRLFEQLENLRIVLPANNLHRTGAPWLYHHHTNFWEGREVCNCVRRKLKFVKVEGFTSKDLEFYFIKYLIERSARIEMINVLCNIDFMEDAKKASALTKKSFKVSHY